MRLGSLVVGFVFIASLWFCGLFTLLIASARTVQKPTIVFASNRDGNWNIFTLDIDGNNLLRLTNLPGTETQPRWSPDGKRILFVSTQNGASQFLTMDANGKDILRVTEPPMNVDAPAWSPDGQHIACYSDRDGEGIYLMDSDGNNLRRLTGPPIAGSHFHPASGIVWSSDSKTILFDADTDFGEIWAIDADGRNARNVSNHPAPDAHPTWSPNGNEILFTSARPNGWRLFVMDSTGQNQRALVNDAWTGDAYPDWMPDGNQILFVSERFGGHDLFRVNTDGQNILRIAALAGNEAYPDVFDPSVLSVRPAQHRRIVWGWLKSIGVEQR